MLLWKWVCKYLIEPLISVLLDIYPEVELLNHMVLLVSIFGGTTIVFSIVVASFSFPKQYTRVTISPHSCQLFLFFDRSYPSWCDMLLFFNSIHIYVLLVMNTLLLSTDSHLKFSLFSLYITMFWNIERYTCKCNLAPQLYYKILLRIIDR